MKVRLNERHAGFVITSNYCDINCVSMSRITFKFVICLLLYLKICCVVYTKPNNFPLCQPHQVESISSPPARSMGLITTRLLPYWDSWFSIWRASEKAPLSLEGPLVVGCFVLLSPSNLASTLSLSLSLHLWGWVMKWVMRERKEERHKRRQLATPEAVAGCARDLRG